VNLFVSQNFDRQVLQPANAFSNLKGCILMSYIVKNDFIAIKLTEFE
jgi:hypothetical protein